MAAGFDETLSDRQFALLSQFIEEHCGIQMPSSKKIMLEARLRKRLRATGQADFEGYLNLVFSEAGKNTELVHMVDSVTTNKTDFFREPQHFDFLVKQAIPELTRRTGAGISRNFMVWSAGCSSGEEPYTLCIVLSEVAEHLRGFDYQILATDISTKVLRKASTAVYEHEKIEPVPMELRRKYLLKSRNREQRLIRIAPQLRDKVHFRRLNFMDVDFGMRETMDVIFCRNVFIYFDRQNQERIIRNFCKHLAPGGYVMLGHSESLNGLDVPLVAVGPSVYQLPR